MYVTVILTVSKHHQKKYKMIYNINRLKPIVNKKSLGVFHKPVPISAKTHTPDHRCGFPWVGVWVGLNSRVTYANPYPYPEAKGVVDLTTSFLHIFCAISTTLRCILQLVLPFMTIFFGLLMLLETGPRWPWEKKVTGAGIEPATSD